MFNSIVEPSQTNPKIFGGRGGVCVKGSFQHVIEKTIYKKYYYCCLFNCIQNDILGDDGGDDDDGDDDDGGDDDEGGKISILHS